MRSLITGSHSDMTQYPVYFPPWIVTEAVDGNLRWWFSVYLVISCSSLWHVITSLLSLLLLIHTAEGASECRM